MHVVCPHCHKTHYNSELGSEAADVLRELVELKRMKDAGTATKEYERRKLITWRKAFRVFGYADEPKP